MPLYTGARQLRTFWFMVIELNRICQHLIILILSDGYEEYTHRGKDYALFIVLQNFWNIKKIKNENEVGYKNANTIEPKIQSILQFFLLFTSFPNHYAFKTSKCEIVSFQTCQYRRGQIEVYRAINRPCFSTCTRFGYKLQEEATVYLSTYQEVQQIQENETG